MIAASKIAAAVKLLSSSIWLPLPLLFLLVGSVIVSYFIVVVVMLTPC
jgi:hypothetical protein